VKVLVHDYSGHPFQAQLSRELAVRGHTVEHVYCASYVSGKGRLERAPGDPASLSFAALAVGKHWDKYSLLRRLHHERTYAREFLSHIDTNWPDVVIMCNVPLVAHALIKRGLLTRKIATVFWHQDVYSHAIGLEARRRLGIVGGLIAHTADRTEAWIARDARAVVAISDHFLPVHERWGTKPETLHVIPNWGPLDDVVPHPRNNSWAVEHGLVGPPVLLYSGTLGLKHDPGQLVALLRGVRRTLPDARLVVVSDGPVADRLRKTAEPGVRVLPFQPFSQLPDVLATGDVLVTILEPEASSYSVPSKTLTYLCAGRPVIGLLPVANPAFSVVAEAGGLAFDLTQIDMASASKSVATLLADQAELDRRGRSARAYAETTFDILRLTDRFEAALGATPSLPDAAGTANQKKKGTSVILLDDSEVTPA
jgi:glycosyltransferase involved in cell wall biosynthesis